MLTTVSVKQGFVAGLLKLWPFLAIGFMLASTTTAQSLAAITGDIVADGGHPIGGVTVIGSDLATSNAQGEFRLEHAGTVIHFLKDGLQPETIVVKPGTLRFRVTMHPSTNSLTVPICGRPGRGERQIGWGKYGPRFTVPVHIVTIKGGEPDTDYIKYVIQPKRGKSYLELWFGPNAISSEPDDKQFVNSSDFSQRNITVAGGGIGMDSLGHLRNGDSWRQTVVLGGGGAVYQQAPPDEASVFDRIINSICTVPYPSQ